MQHEGLRRILIVTAFGPVAACAQFSPGALSKAHHALEGSTQCTSCHVAGGGSAKFKCLSCHTEIRQRLSINRGLHPSLVGRGRDDSCVKCHSEHNGVNFVPIRWDISPREFDHRKAGYLLEGGHAGLACNRCHNPEHIPQSARRGIVMKDLRRTYLGLSRDCQTCHRDEHKGQLGANCERCHTTTRWKDVTRFDHSTAKLRLTGAHVQVACAKCHTSVPSQDGGRPHIQYVGVAFQQCVSCHRDVHRGAFAAPCSECHSDISWKQARNVTTSFDHSKTKFPLLGKHQAVTCEKCHRTADFKAQVAHERCDSCHKDVHGGQFLARSDQADCRTCHTADGWKPSTFTVTAHARSAYPLAGRHATVTCAECHKPAGPATVYRVRFDSCENCHRDAHAGQFTAASFKNRCEACHTVDQFQPAKFTLARHAETQFPLKGAHVAVACGDCHLKRLDLHDAVAYRFSDLSCNGCHQDPHQFRDTAKCEGCHTAQTWREISAFDHSKTRFQLAGSHRGVSCEQCHRATALSIGVRRVVFQSAPRACGGCHEDIHGGQFNSSAGTRACADCHRESKWRPSLFDHNTAHFQLSGAHANVRCGACHTNRKEVSGRTVLLYKSAPKECSACHGLETKN